MLDATAETHFLISILAGVGGGLILNIMPCVLPGLFFKVQAILQQLHSGESQAERRREGVGFLIGVQLSFTVLAGVVILLRASGQTLGWGMQMQSPPFVGGLMVVTFLFALNAFELFLINPGFTQGETRSGFSASVGEGVFITLLTIPCSAPILGTAITAALASDGQWWETLALFWAIGFGLAIPILLVSFTDFFLRWVPKHGEWTEHFKRLVGLSLITATVWLYTQYQNLVSEEQAHRALYGFCVIAALFLAYPLWRNRGRWLKMSFNILALSLALLTGKWASEEPIIHLDWHPFNEVALQDHIKEGHPVFLDFTADWCQSCKVFEGIYLNTATTAELFAMYKVIPMQADLTKHDQILWDKLKSFKRTGIPAYILYHPNGKIDLLPEGPPLTLEERVRSLGQSN